MRVILSLVLIGLMNAGMAQAGEIRVSFAMDVDPEFEVLHPIKFFPAGYKPLWLQALARPESDMQRLAAESIGRAHEFGFPGMSEARPKLLELLKAEKSHPTVRFAAARALIVMETRDAAPALFETSQRYGSDLRQLIESHLGAWKFQPLDEVWRARLKASDVRHRELLLAIEGVVQLGDVDSVPQLLGIVHDGLRSPAARLAAARAAGKLSKSGLEPDATKLVTVSSPPILNRLCAGLLFANHTSESSRTLLQQWAVDPEPSVAAAALGRLLEINPDLVVTLAEGAMKSPDPIVRQRGAECYIARPDPQRLVRLVVLLDDEHPTVRGHVREALYKHCKTPEFDVVLRPALMNLMGAESWRGQEQAALLLASLDHKAAAPRLIQLLESPRDEVLTTAAWGLRKLAIPETLPAILDKALRQTALREKEPVQPLSLDHQVVHLFETMGMLKYAPAEPLFRKHIPKNFGLGELSRGAAIWSLGHLYVNRPDEALVKQLSERMSDTMSIPPELLHVQVMSTVSLGRMQAKSQIQTMKTLLGTSDTSAQPFRAYRWALNHMTGESFPPFVPVRYSKSNWFLAPLDDDSTKE